MRYSKDELSKTLLITHKDCPDGCGCAVIFRAAGGSKDNIKYVSAGRGVGEFFKKNVDYLNGFDRIICADVAPDPDAAQKIEKEFTHVIVIDHHKTATFLQDKEWCHIDMTKCGTYLLYEYLFGEFNQSQTIVGKDAMLRAALHNFAVLTNDRDLWLRQLRKSNEMSMMMDFLGKDRYVERAMEDYFAFDWKPYEIDLLDILAEKKDKYINEMVDKTRIVNRDGVKFGYVFISMHNSDVLNRVIEVHDVDAAIGIMLDGTGFVSMRSKETFDSSEFCSKHGGGGHMKAAGHPIDEDTMREIMETVHP